MSDNIDITDMCNSNEINEWDVGNTQGVQLE